MLPVELVPTKQRETCTTSTGVSLLFFVCFRLIIIHIHIINIVLLTLNHTLADQDSYEPHSRRKFNPKSNLLIAHDFGKRSGNDDVNDEGKICQKYLNPMLKKLSKALNKRKYNN